MKSTSLEMAASKNKTYFNGVKISKNTIALTNLQKRNIC